MAKHSKPVKVIVMRNGIRSYEYYCDKCKNCVAELNKVLKEGGKRVA